MSRPGATAGCVLRVPVGGGIGRSGLRDGSGATLFDFFPLRWGAGSRGLAGLGAKSLGESVRKRTCRVRAFFSAAGRGCAGLSFAILPCDFAAQTARAAMRRNERCMKRAGRKLAECVP